jgi:hypothetical protein
LFEDETTGIFEYLDIQIFTRREILDIVNTNISMTRNLGDKLLVLCLGLARAPRFGLAAERGIGPKSGLNRAGKNGPAVGACQKIPKHSEGV